MAGLGNPISFLLSGGEIHDSKIPISLLETINTYDSRIIADRAYVSEEIRTYIIQHNASYGYHQNIIQNIDWQSL